MSLPPTQLLCGIPQLIAPSHAPPITQPISDDTFILPLIQPKTPSEQYAEPLQPPPGSSSFLPRLFNISRNFYRRFRRPSNSSINTLRQNNSNGSHYNFFSFNFRVTLHYCATCFSLRLEQLPSTILLFMTPLSVHQIPLNLTLNLTLTLTLLQIQSRFPTLMNYQFVALPRRALYDHPERKQSILQTTSFSPNPTHGRTS